VKPWIYVTLGLAGGAILYLGYERYRHERYGPRMAAAWGGGLMSRSAALAASTGSAPAPSGQTPAPAPQPQPVRPQPVTVQPAVPYPLPQPIPGIAVPREPRPDPSLEPNPATTDEISLDMNPEPVYVSPDDLRRGAQIFGAFAPILGFVNPVVGAVTGAVARGIATVADLMPPPQTQPTLGQDNETLPGYTDWLALEKGYTEPQPVVDYGPSIPEGPSFSIGNAVDRIWGGASDLFAGGGADSTDFSIGNAVKSNWL